jgi:hypothetical protein
VAAVGLERDHGKDIVVRLVQCGKNLIAGDRDRISVGDPPLHFNEPQRTGRRMTTFDVVPQTLCFTVGWFVPQPTFDVHDDGASACGNCLRIHRSG